MIRLEHKGDLSKTTLFLERARSTIKASSFDKYGEEGVRALMNATPRDTGLTAESWFYKVVFSSTSVKLQFFNSNVQDGVPIAIILQYGHATRNGGYVEGRDYINPAVRPIFDKMMNDMWKEVTKK